MWNRFPQNREIGSNLWNHFPNSYLILWKTKWNHHGSTCGTIFPFLGWENCGTILVPHSGDTTLDTMWNQIGSTWFSIELSMNWENGSTNWNQSLYFRENGSTFLSKLGKWFHIVRATVVPQQFCNFLIERACHHILGIYFCLTLIFTVWWFGQQRYLKF